MQLIKNPKNIKESLDWGVCELEAAGVKDAKFNVEVMLTDIFGLEKNEIYTSLEKEVQTKEAGKFFEYIESRKQGTPLQYVIGYTYFRGLKICVGPQVLIPRPETELLLEYAIKSLDVKNPKVLDLCTGSGCIACSFSNEVKNSKIVAVDVSSFACDCAKKNSENLGFGDRIEVINADISEDLNIDNDFDMLVSNPPYVPNDVYETLDKEVYNFEPSLALRGGQDGMKFVPRIIQIAKTHLKPGGTLAMELFEDSLGEASEIAKKEGLENIKTLKDLANKDRFLFASVI